MKNLYERFCGFLFVGIGIASVVAIVTLPDPITKMDALGFATAVFVGIPVGLIGVLLIASTFEKARV